MTTTPPRSDRHRRLIAESGRYAEQVDRSRLGAPRQADLAILTCMDTRIVVEDLFALRTGDAIVIRNAGAVAAEDALRSLILSQQLLGTNEVIVLGHTGCGLSGLADGELRRSLERTTGATSDIAFGSFDDLDRHVRRQVDLIRSHPWVKPVPVTGLIYEVETGLVREVA